MILENVWEWAEGLENTGFLSEGPKPFRISTSITLTGRRDIIKVANPEHKTILTGCKTDLGKWRPAKESRQQADKAWILKLCLQVWIQLCDRFVECHVLVLLTKLYPPYCSKGMHNVKDRGKNWALTLYLTLHTPEIKRFMLKVYWKKKETASLNIYTQPWQPGKVNIIIWRWLSGRLSTRRVIVAQSLTGSGDPWLYRNVAFLCRQRSSPENTAQLSTKVN